MRIVTVLRSGGEYKPKHVERLAKQCARYAPDTRMLCLSDVETCVETVPLRYNWPGWWAKLEMFANVREPFLYMDLDTTIVGRIDDFLARRTLTVLSDFYRPRQIGSGLMLVTPEAAAMAWAAFQGNPAGHMQECNMMPAKWGDQGFLEGIWGRHIARWQDKLLPGRVVSYKKHCLHGIPDAAGIVCFHGKPRPWEI